MLFSIPLSIYLRVELMVHVIIPFNYLRNHKTVCILAAQFYIYTSNVSGFQFHHILTNTFFNFFITILIGIKWYLIVVLIYISLITNNVEHLFMYLMSISISLIEICLLKSFPNFSSFLLFLVVRVLHIFCVVTPYKINDL